MECPKCSNGNDDDLMFMNVDPSGEHHAYRCMQCGEVFTDHQQAEIESLRAQVAALTKRAEKAEAAHAHAIYAIQFSRDSMALSYHELTDECQKNLSWSIITLLDSLKKEAESKRD